MKIEEQYLRQAIELAARARELGNHPFGALLSFEGRIVVAAVNTVNIERDPTAHAEINLLREAVRGLKPEELSRSTLYTSCEPCAMCVGAIYWAGVREVVYALSSTELAKLAGSDFMIPCRELFARASRRVEVAGPLLTEEAMKVHEGYWS
ncbi:MAG TPA: nucleoside deaminase [Pyrinomonadaceae bacterium]|jgi:tRNA(Arg) A34 adenosine deaminase TadA